jgi:hypothetical protein
LNVRISQRHADARHNPLCDLLGLGAGATTANHASEEKPSNVSATAGTSASEARRSSVPSPRIFSSYQRARDAEIIET